MVRTEWFCESSGGITISLRVNVKESNYNKQHTKYNRLYMAGVNIVTVISTWKGHHESYHCKQYLGGIYSTVQRF